MGNQEGQYLDQQFGNYRLVKLLGEGGFAEVYLGEHVYINTNAAVKVLNTKLMDDEIAQLRREAQLTIGLKHPNIVHVYDFGMEGRIPFIVMDYASNGSLRLKHPKGTCLDTSTIITYVKQIAAALQYVHDQNLIHRDLKPENMLVGSNQEVLLSDFGIAAIAHSTSSLQTQAQSGTIYYMAPEQLQGKPRIESDQYALGVILYEWICGSRPFIGSYTEIATQHILASPIPLHEKIPHISPAVEQVVMKALAKDPHQRFANVLEFVHAFEHACQPASTRLLESTPISLAPPSQTDKVQFTKEDTHGSLIFSGKK